MSEPLLRIHNHHVPGMGDPPILNNDDPNCYVGYFASNYGDQWLFTFNRTTKVGELRGGDATWNRVFRVEDGCIDPNEMFLNEAESLWLMACWAAVVPASALAARFNWWRTRRRATYGGLQTEHAP
jgi:hypothetical protein